MSNTNTAQQPSSEKKSISCVTCNAPLPIGADGEVEEPGYFARVSIGWKPEHIGDRDAEDIDTMLRHMRAVTDAIRDKFRLIKEESKKQDPDVERSTYLEEARSLCSLLEDLHEEAERRIRGLDTWLRKEIQAEELTEEAARRLLRVQEAGLSWQGRTEPEREWTKPAEGRD